jgi:hypothetical protein
MRMRILMRAVKMVMTRMTVSMLAICCNADAEEAGESLRTIPVLLSSTHP